MWYKDMCRKYFLSQIGTVFKDDDLDQHYSYLKERTISAPKPYYRWSESVTPDHWFDSSQLQVWEIKAADLSISPVYPAAAGKVSWYHWTLIIWSPVVSDVTHFVWYTCFRCELSPRSVASYPGSRCGWQGRRKESLVRIARACAKWCNHQMVTSYTTVNH